MPMIGKPSARSVLGDAEDVAVGRGHRRLARVGVGYGRTTAHPWLLAHAGERTRGRVRVWIRSKLDGRRPRRRT